MNPYKVVAQFEEMVSSFAGAYYGVAVESGTAAIFLSLQYRKHELDLMGEKKPVNVFIPKFTYPSVPCSIIQTGWKVHFTDSIWGGCYRLDPVNVIDGALRFSRGMYQGGLHCVSFHMKKHLPIGRGGMILTDDLEAYKWLKRARFDGRNEVDLNKDHFTQLGWNMYMTPEQAIRGIQLFKTMPEDGYMDLTASKQGYPDLSQYKVYQT